MNPLSRTKSLWQKLKMERKTKNKESKRKKETVKTLAVAGRPISLRGKTFEGNVIKKFPTRVVIEIERMIHVKKYERYSKAKTKIHARLPAELEKEVKVGDYIKVKECRPLSKIIHFVVVEKIRDGGEKK